MKSIRFCLATIALPLVLGLLGCTSENPTDAQVSGLDFESGEFAIFTAADAVDGIEAATLDKEMRFNPGLLNGGLFRDGGPFGRRGPRGPFGPGRLGPRGGNHLRGVLPDLNLAEDQKSRVREFMVSHRE